MSDDTPRRFPSGLKGVAAGRTGVRGGRGSIANWWTIAILRDQRRLWLDWLGWNGPTLTQPVRTREAG
jgi:hypothetical protein